MSDVYFTSDTHFNHKNIIELSQRWRQGWGTVEEMNEGMIERWNKVVKPDDLVYHLGDVVMGQRHKAGEVLSRLNGKIFLVQGNHDTELPRERFEKRVDFAEVFVNQQRISLCHFSLRVWNKKSHGAWALFGHSHGGLEPWGKSVDVGVDSTWITGVAEYRPFHFDEIKAFMDKRDIKVVDHHGRKEPLPKCMICLRDMVDEVQACIGEYTTCIKG